MFNAFVSWQNSKQLGNCVLMLTAKAAGIEILVDLYTADLRTSGIVQFPGGYIAEIHSNTGKTN